MEVIEKTVSDRIMEAADDLYEKNGRTGFPLVDDVRKAAKANMNAVSQVMKKWRVQKLAQTIPVSVDIPIVIEQVNRTALVALWQAAQEQASGSLRSAQMGWDAERVESDAVNAQTADAYEAKSAALATALADIARLQASAEEATSGRVALQSELDALRTQMAVDHASTEQHARQIEEEHAREIARLLAMVDAERAKLEAAQEATRLANEQHAAEVARLNAALDEARKRHAEEVAQQRGELVEQAQKAREAQEELRAKIAASNALAEAARQQQDLAQKSARERVEVADHAAGQARESVARLDGQVQTLETQVAGLMRILADRLATQTEAKSAGGG